MADQLSAEAVTNFLKDNPEFLNNWLSNRGLSELGDERHRKNSQAQVLGNAFLNYVQNIVQRKRIPQSKVIYNEVNKNDLFKELVRDIADELDVNVLCHKILQNVCILTRSDRGSLFLVRRSPSEQYLVSKLFDVTATSLLDESLHSARDAIHIRFGEGIVGIVAETRKAINIKNAYNDPRFNREIDMRTGYHTRCMMSLPIFGLEDEIVGVACVVNKSDGDYFTNEDEEIFRDYLAFCGIGINNAQLFEIKVEEFKRNQLLLHLVRQITRELGDLKRLVQVILQEALGMLDCNCVTVFLLDISNRATMRFSNIFELTNCKMEFTECMGDHRLTKLAGKCIMSGEVVYNPTVYDVGRNLPDLNNLFCINIMNATSVCIGCIIFNREFNDAFCRSDLEMMGTFALFCGIGLQNAQNYEVAVKSEEQKQIALDVLANHTIAPATEVERLMSFKTMTVEEMHIYQFDFNDMIFSNDETVLVCVQLFLEIKTLQLLDIPLNLLYHWVLTVKKNYRNVIYHNWRHGLNVAQTMFCLLTTGQMNKHFSDHDCVYLMVASLCHDLDHRGTNNAFQVKVASPLATLYSTSVMEHHHIDRSLMILSEPATSLFKNLCSTEYKHALKMVEHAILSTDLVIYFEKRNQFKHLVESGEKAFVTAEHLDLLLSMMMTACDLSAITKPWKVQRKVALIVAREFYFQGDMEKQLEETVIPLMDRDKRQDLPKMQVSFIDFVCVTVYKYLAEMNELLSPLYHGCMSNRENWGNIASGKAKFDVDKRIKKQEGSKNFFLLESSEEEVSQTEVDAEEGSVDAKAKVKEEGKENVNKVEKKEEKKGEAEKEQKDKEVKENDEKEKAGKENEEKVKKENEGKENKEKKEREDSGQKEKEENERKEKKEREDKEKEKERKEKEDKEKKEKDDKEKKEKEEKEKKEREEKEKAEKEEKENAEKKKLEDSLKKEDTSEIAGTSGQSDTPGEPGAKKELPELKSRRTYRQPTNPILERRSSIKPCVDELAEAHQKRMDKRHSTIKPAEEVKPLRIQRKSTVVVPPNPVRTKSFQLDDSHQSQIAQRVQRLSTFNEYSSSSSRSECEDSLRSDSLQTQPLRKLTGRTSRMEVPDMKLNLNYAAITEGDDEDEEDVIPDIHRRLSKRLTGPNKYVANNNRPSRYISK